jgi:flagellar motor switch/type III secretory pathway protein FliN
MQVRPFALLGSRRMNAVRDGLERALAVWAEEWGLAETTVTVQRAWDAPPISAAWQCARLGSGGGSIWLAWPVDMPEQLQRQLFAPDRRHGPQQGQATLASAAAEAALAALADCLAHQTLGSATPAAALQPTAGLRHHASGAVVFEARIGKLACHGLLDHAAVLGLHAARAMAPLPPLDLLAVLAPQPVQLKVAVGKAEVTLGSLIGLDIGDVIRLDSLVEQPFAVRGDDGRTLFGGHLGMAGNKLALEVVPGN